MSPEIAAAITRAAQEAGENPAFALAVADRESDGNPNAKASKTIYGLFQMSRELRDKYGIGNSSDPYTQAAGWMRFIQDTRNGMAQRMGRQPTDAELYMGHYFGEGRGARIAGQLPANTDVRDVFTPQELALNPNLARAGTTGAVVDSITGDINGRMARFGGDATATNAYQPVPDFASFGESHEAQGAGAGSGNFWKPNRPQSASNEPQVADFAQFGKTQDELQPAAGPAQTQTQAPTSFPGSEVDVSQFGQPQPTAPVQVAAQ